MRSTLLFTKILPIIFCLVLVDLIYFIMFLSRFFWWFAPVYFRTSFTLENSVLLISWSCNIYSWECLISFLSSLVARIEDDWRAWVPNPYLDWARDSLNWIDSRLLKVLLVVESLQFWEYLLLGLTKILAFLRNGWLFLKALWFF